MDVIKELLALLQQEYVVVVAIRVHHVDHLEVDEQQRVQVSSLDLVDVPNVVIRWLVRLVGVFHVPDCLVVDAKARLDDLLLKVQAEEHADLVGERVAFIDFDISMDVEGRSTLEDVCLQVHQV